MKFNQQHTLKQIATIISSKMDGDPDFPVLGMNEIHVVEPGDIVFVDHPKYYQKALNSAATIILINAEVSRPEGKALLISEDPFRDFNILTEYFRPFQKATSSVAASATIGKETVIQPNCFIGNNVIIGDNCLIHANVSIYDNSIIGDNVTIHSGSVLGADAFYYKKRPQGFDKLRSGGRVVVKDNVDIGALCTIDKGVSGDTTIGAGSKLDNQVHIGHDVLIGERVLIASQAGIAGCVIIENDVTIWGQAGVKSDIRLGAGSVLMAQSGVGNDLEAGKSYFGSPAMESRLKFKELLAVRQLPDYIDKLKNIQ
ncbi:UDP-3-O-(3-hydroxymyristoyl)glucosamine N-acyltransferase [Flavimarina sp. Hel_I_48]|uniref:UDP-3-O-(3-hydroxymyristoyl)glucosamine N-acyltransferase n=1 Tax=Flavimarina sp. Hel_I_48 TaxID=1392488 RepID=UPI0004DEEBD5|nr:UDP-3-O-(3-hydroxymyristoyl)glucosamine N-acyltransferase [Flavimarina sp. Hel_I_48]